MTPTALQDAPYYSALAVVAAAAGALLAFWPRRRTTLSIRNLYVLAAVAVVVDAALFYGRVAPALWVMVPLTSFAVAGSAIGRRWRLSDLGAGEELRTYELARRWLWQPPAPGVEGERVHIVTQGQIVRDRPWPTCETYVPLTADIDGPRVPRKSGRHVFCVGATGSGKTTSALRAAAGRALKDRSALFFVDQKGDPLAREFLPRLAAGLGVPFILLDPRAVDTDRWQPLWGDRPAEVVARVLAGIDTSEPYYADTLRLHVGIVASVLHTAGYWPPSLPLLVEASQRARFDMLVSVREMYRSARAHGLVGDDAIEVLFVMGVVADVGVSERPVQRFALRPRHVLRSEEQGEVLPVSREEFAALMSVTRCWRDRLLLVLMRHAGLRRGEAVNLLEEDLHLMRDARELGCARAGAHLHVRRRTTEQGSSAKSKRERIVPVDAVTVFCADRWYYERARILGAERSATVLVNVAGERAGRPLRVDHVNSIVADLSRRARLQRQVTPHMLRHAWATGLAGVADLAVVRDLLGHRHLQTTARYVHPEWQQMREAIDGAYLETVALDDVEVGR